MLVVHFSFISPYTCNGDFSQSDQTIFYTVSLNFQRIVPVSYGFYVVSYFGLSFVLN